jgi:hypothetical protein
MNEPVRVWIIDRMLKESLANALYDPARDLAFEQERVDGAPEIVDDGIAPDYDAAGIGIDLDLGDLAADRVSAVWVYRPFAVQGVILRSAGTELRKPVFSDMPVSARAKSTPPPRKCSPPCGRALVDTSRPARKTQAARGTRHDRQRGAERVQAG